RRWAGAPSPGGGRAPRTPMRCALAPSARGWARRWGTRVGAAGRGSRSRHLHESQVSAIAGRQSALSALAVRGWLVDVGRVCQVGGGRLRQSRAAPRPRTPCKGVRVGSGVANFARSSLVVRANIARTVPGLTCGFASGTQLAHAFSRRGSLLLDRRAGRLVVTPVVELVATLDPLPQTTLDQLAHGPLRVVAEPSG